MTTSTKLVFQYLNIHHNQHKVLLKPSTWQLREQHSSSASSQHVLRYCVLMLRGHSGTRPSQVTDEKGRLTCFGWQVAYLANEKSIGIYWRVQSVGENHGTIPIPCPRYSNSWPRPARWQPHKQQCKGVLLWDNPHKCWTKNVGWHVSADNSHIWYRNVSWNISADKWCTCVSWQLATETWQYTELTCDSLFQDVRQTRCVNWHLSADTGHIKSRMTYANPTIIGGHGGSHINKLWQTRDQAYVHMGRGCERLKNQCLIDAKNISLTRQLGTHPERFSRYGQMGHIKSLSY